ncbi:MAG: SipW-dependent-type signal peptide-containing protein, partial [Christensenellales bacterium]
MKGKKKDKKKVGKTILLAMSFVMVVVLTFTITLAWFYDSDWASNSVTMAGSVGIELRDNTGATTSGAGQLHFDIQGTYAYPGQAVDVSASVYNNGGVSVAENGKTGSPCYVRARFVVYTDIGVDVGDEDAANMNAEILYEFLQALIEEQNDAQTTYKWEYYQNTNSHMQLDGKYWYQGVSSASQDTKTDAGYFYLCETGETTKTLKILNVGETSAFLWNSTFIIPWQLTNVSADKHIFVAVEFQAIQTFIPKMNNGSIVTDADNQLPAVD